MENNNDKIECEPTDHNYQVAYVETYKDGEPRFIYLFCTKCGKEKVL